jgi:hypothetical protein
MLAEELFPSSDRAGRPNKIVADRMSAEVGYRIASSAPFRMFMMTNDKTERSTANTGDSRDPIFWRKKVALILFAVVALTFLVRDLDIP